jgi:sporulation protein YlmC with PRC-barrel domain
MWKKLMITTALTGLMIGTAMAQGSAPSSGNTTAPPAATQTAPKSDRIAPSSGGSAHFISTQQADQYLASRFKGTDVVGPDNKSVGTITDILFDKSGTIKAYIVSVGGFLGVGSKDVALGPQAFEVMPGDKSKGESDKLKVAMNADDLKQAAGFEPYNPPRPVSTTSGAGSAPRPMPMSPRNGS